jgi:hypothetical protein
VHIKHINSLGSEGGDPMRGVKGWSALLDLDCFDPVDMIPVEVMHTFDQGVVKYFFKLWCPRKPKKEKPQTSDTDLPPWRLNEQQLLELERRINDVRVPHSISRSPKFKNRDKWKADGM